jgi:hypothetical protein
VVHLHRRAGFAATWGELQRDLKDGPGAAIGRLLAGKARGEGVPADFAATADTLARLAVQSGDTARLKAWWVFRMLLGPDPLGERLTLFWHNHFATSAAKVGLAVHRQNEVFRAYPRAPFGELLPRVVANHAAALVGGEHVGLPEAVDVRALAGRHGERDVVAYYTRLLLGAEPTPAWRDRLAAGLGPEVKGGDGAARRAVALLLSMPEYQLC